MEWMNEWKTSGYSSLSRRPNIYHPEAIYCINFWRIKQDSKKETPEKQIYQKKKGKDGYSTF